MNSHSWWCSRALSGLALPVALGVLAVSGASAHAADEQGMPIIHTETLYDLPNGRADAIGGPAGWYGSLEALQKDLTSKDPKAQARAAEALTALFDSRSEFEAHEEIIGGDKELRAVRQALKELAGDEALAKKVLGSKWRITPKANYQMSDSYMDNKKRVLADKDAGLRHRIVNKTGLGQINYKPPGGTYFGPKGKHLLLGRVELALPLGPNFTTEMLPQVAASKSRFNPVRSLRNAGSYLDPSIGVDQDRDKFNLENFEGGQWNPLIELSGDKVMGRDLRGEVKGTVEFPFFEADLDHPGNQGGVVLTGIPWKAPHKPADLEAFREQIEKDPYIKMTLEVLPRLKAHLMKRAGVKMVPARPKASLVAERLGLIKPNAALAVPQSRLIVPGQARRRAPRRR